MSKALQLTRKGIAHRLMRIGGDVRTFTNEYVIKNLGIDLAWEILAGEKDFAWGAGFGAEKRIGLGSRLGRWSS